MRIRKNYIMVMLFIITSLLGNIYAINIDKQKIMDYPMDHIRARYCKDQGVSEEDAKVYEQELKKWFVVVGMYPDKIIDMFSEEVDELWHTFLLFTQDYQKFCEECFGRFIHHVPKIDSH